MYPRPRRVRNGSSWTVLGEGSPAVVRQAGQETDFAQVVENSPDLTVALDGQGVMRYVSTASHRILRRPSTALLGYPLAGLVHPEDRGRLAELLAPHEADPEWAPDSAELRLSHVNGSWVRFEAMRWGSDGGRRLINLRDVSDRTAREEQLRTLALHDSLTLLANRTLFRDHVRHALAHPRRSSAQHAVLFMDLDDFKTINDSLGHAAGDAVLVTVADRLRSRLRPNDIVARLGGDEFAVLVENASERDAVELGQRILESLQLPVMVHNKRVVLSGSMGIAMSEFAADDEQLLRNSDVAMYRAKAAGKNRLAVFKPEMHVAALRRLDLEADLRRAVECDGLFVEYQPIVDLRTGEMVKVEVLARWCHPERGVIRPDEFIAVAEESGLIRSLGLLVLRQACAQALRWHRGQGCYGPRLGVCVNVSVRQLQSPTFVDEVESCLARFGIDPASLTLEITESVFMAEFEATLEKLLRLKRLGIKLAIDDFGTGYSSLNYLRDLPVDVLKIDKSFVDGVTRGPEQSAVARAVVKLARTFELQTVAEGIERPEQASELLVIGADLGQGYYFAKPMGAGDITALLARDDGPRLQPPPSLVRSTGSVRSDGQP